MHHVCVNKFAVPCKTN